jgi:hypothetical protein
MRIVNSIRVKNRRRAAGTTLVEVLVVMVIFLLGMLAMMQVFPGGLRILRQNRDMTVGTALGRGEMERLTGKTVQLPEAILPVTAVWNLLGQVAYVVDSNRKPFDLEPIGAATIDENGHMRDASDNDLGPWQYLSGANVTRRIVGEGGVIPAPRAVGGAFGGLLVLQFAPIVFSPNYEEFFEVYGNDMVQRYGDPTFGRVRPWEYFLNEWDQPTAYINVPRSTTQNRRYKLALSALINDGGNVKRVDVVATTPIDVPADVAGGFVKVDLAPYLPAGTLVSVDPDTVRVARLFARVNSFSADPYEYRLLDETLGLVLFNPAGYNYEVRTSRGGRVPLTGRVNYDVLDWRILREEFRIPDTDNPVYQLAIGNLAIKGSSGTDGRPTAGFPIPAGSGTYANGDFALVDLDTGGVYLRSSLFVDGSRGVVTFIDKDGDPSNGVQLDLLLPGDASATTVTATSRSVRALYQGTGEWAVQVMKAPSVFRSAWDAPGVAQYYVGTSNPALGNPGLPTRIYFPWNDAGKKVTIGTIHYFAGGVAKTIEGQDFVIRTKPADTFGYPFVNLLDVDPFATGFDFTTYGYAVRDVQGASISVRVLWNSAYFSLSTDRVQNMKNFNAWLGNWRRNETETFLQRSEN